MNTPRVSRSLHQALGPAVAVISLLLLASCDDDDNNPSSTTVDRGEKTPTTLGRADDAPGIVFTITGVAGASGGDGSFQVGDRVAVTFTIKKKNGAWWRIDDFSTAGR